MFTEQTIKEVLYQINIKIESITIVITRKSKSDIWKVEVSDGLFSFEDFEVKSKKNKLSVIKSVINKLLDSYLSEVGLCSNHLECCKKDINNNYFVDENKRDIKKCKERLKYYYNNLITKLNKYLAKLPA